MVASKQTPKTGCLQAELHLAHQPPGHRDPVVRPLAAAPEGVYVHAMPGLLHQSVSVIDAGCCPC